MAGERLSYSMIQDCLAEHGLIARGGYHPETDDGVPPLAGGHPAATVVMVGNAGSGLWPHFSGSPEARCTEHPLDQWTRRVLGQVGERLGATVFLPFDGPPYLPFQRWARRADTVWPSPLGLLIHPAFGLWHAYRGALAFEPRLPLPKKEGGTNPCDSCEARPCLRACPVEAFARDGFADFACRDHLASDRGGACVEAGCLARRACPVGRDWHYDQPHMAFHMRWFAFPNDGGAAV